MRRLARKPMRRLAGLAPCCATRHAVRCEHTHSMSQSMFWLSDRMDGRQTRDAGDCTSAAVATAREALRRTTPLERTTSSTPPLVLDPPFTPVPGESGLLHQIHQEHPQNIVMELQKVLYDCKVCGTTLFRSRNLTPSSSVGSHIGGWPSFTEPASARALRLRGLLQRATIQGGRNLIAAKRSDTNDLRDCDHLEGISAAPFTTTLAVRGLPVEGEMVRTTRGGRCEPLKLKTWREACLRDVNKRCDPALLEGCCASCSLAVCRVVTVRGGALKYVVNPTAVVARLSEEKQQESHEIE